MSTPDTFTELLREELSPAPAAEFAAEMDAWVAGGFHRREPARRDSWFRRAARTIRSPIGMAGATAAVAAALIAALLVADGTQQSGPTGEPSAGSGASTELVRPSPGATPSDSRGKVVVPPEAGASGIAPGEGARRVERSSELTLAAPADDFQSVGDRILQVTDRHSGYVLRSNVSTGDQPSGDFQLRIPAAELQPALRDLSALGDVKARSDSGQDVTSEYVSVSDRLAAARAERRSLLRRLAAATDDARIQRLRDRLDANATELASLRGQVRDLRERTNYAAVTVTLVEKKGGKGGGATGGSTDDALHDSLGLLVGSFNWLLRALGVLIPAALLGGAAWWAGRTFRRRRREAVLF